MDHTHPSSAGGPPIHFQHLSLSVFSFITITDLRLMLQVGQLWLLFQGIEDYMGDMDFKMAGSKHGVTALQVVRLSIVANSALFSAVDTKYENYDIVVYLIFCIITFLICSTLQQLSL